MLCPSAWRGSQLLHTCSWHARGNERHSIVCKGTQQGSGAPTTQQPAKPGLGLKAVWVGAEQFGNLVGLRSKQPASDGRQQAAPAAPLSREEVLASLRADYDANYFVTGAGDLRAYEPDCLFADPFASFRGVQRFKRNVSNLGSLTEDVQIDILDWQEADNQVKTTWRFSAILRLPWRPRLAAGGSTTHVLNPETGRVMKHIEAWSSAPGPVLRRLLRPANRLPANQWEVLFCALDSGDVVGVWLALSGSTLRVALPAATLAGGAHLLFGHSLPGPLPALEVVAYLLTVAAAVTEVVKLAQGMQGGET